MNKRITYLFTVCAAMLLFFGVAPSKAQVKKEMRIGYVNPTTVLQKMPESKAVQQRLQNFAQKEQKDMTTKQKAFQNELSNYQKQQSVMSKAAQQKKEKALGKMRANLQKEQRKAQQAIQKKQQQLYAPLYKDIQNSIDNVAKKKNLSYVINTQLNNGDQVILYASDAAKSKFDITEAVMDDLGIGN